MTLVYKAQLVCKLQVQPNQTIELTLHASQTAPKAVPKEVNFTGMAMSEIGTAAADQAAEHQAPALQVCLDTPLCCWDNTHAAVHCPQVQHAYRSKPVPYVAQPAYNAATALVSDRKQLRVTVCQPNWTSVMAPPGRLTVALLNLPV